MSKKHSEKAGPSAGASAAAPQKEQTEKDKVAQLLNCNLKQVQFFEKPDPFNPENMIKGYMSRKEGRYGGSLLLTHVNNTKINSFASPPSAEEEQAYANDLGLLIYGTPKLAYPYRNFDSYEYKEFPVETKSYLLCPKWNGMNVLLFWYHDHTGKRFISGKSKGSPFLTDGDFGSFFSSTVEALALTYPSPIVKGSNGLPLFLSSDHTPAHPVLSRLFDVSSGVQSIAFELCGNTMPHLVKYSFGLALKPLFHTLMDGRILPEMPEPGSEEASRTLGPFPFNQSECVAKCQEMQISSFEENEAFRRSNGLKLRYEYNHFAVEGHVMYLLKEDGSVPDRTLYKIKPKDIEEVHWSNFDQVLEGRVSEALEKVKQRERAMTLTNLRDELDMNGEKEWGRFGKAIIKFVKDKHGPEYLAIDGMDSHVGSSSSSNPDDE